MVLMVALTSPDGRRDSALVMFGYAEAIAFAKKPKKPRNRVSIIIFATKPRLEKETRFLRPPKSAIAFAKNQETKKPGFYYHLGYETETWARNPVSQSSAKSFSGIEITALKTILLLPVEFQRRVAD